jgi:hypothetical protein
MAPSARWRGEPRVVAALIPFVAALVVGGPVVAPVGAQTVDSPESLTLRLIALDAKIQSAEGTEIRRSVAEAAALSAQRRSRLAALIARDPATVLRVAIPDAQQADLSPEVRAYVERNVRLEGTFGIGVADYDNRAEERYFLETAAGQVTLHFVKRPSPALHGARVEVKAFRSIPRSRSPPANRPMSRSRPPRRSRTPSVRFRPP